MKKFHNYETVRDMERSACLLINTQYSSTTVFQKSEELSDNGEGNNAGVARKQSLQPQPDGKF